MVRGCPLCWEDGEKAPAEKYIDGEASAQTPDLGAVHATQDFAKTERFDFDESSG